MELRLERKSPYRLQIVEGETVIHELPLGSLGLIHVLKGLLDFTPFCSDGETGGIFDGRDSEWVIWHNDEEQHGKGLLHFTVNEEGRIEEEDEHDEDNLDDLDEAYPAPYEPDLSSVEPASDSVVDEAAAKQQLDDLLRQVSKINWVKLYHDATTGNLLPSHELCMEAGNDPSVILRPKFWSAAAKPDNASWLKRFGGDPSAKPSENLEQINTVLEAFGIKKDKLHHLANLYPVGDAEAASHPAEDKSDDVEQGRKAT